MTPPRNPDPTSRHERLRHEFMFREALATHEGREALKALLTEDRLVVTAYRAYWSTAVGGKKPMEDALAAAVDALDSPEGKGR